MQGSRQTTAVSPGPPPRVPVRERGPVRIGEVLPAVLARYGITMPKKQATAKQPTAAKKKVTTEAIVWAAVGIIGKKEFRREEIGLGPHKVDLSIDALVDGKKKFQADFTALLTVGVDYERSTSSACDTDHLVGLLLAKFSEKDREKLLTELPAQFVKLKNKLPPVDANIVESAKLLLSKLRSHSKQTAKGSVSGKYLPRKAVPEDWPTKP